MDETEMMIKLIREFMMDAATETDDKVILSMFSSVVQEIDGDGVAVGSDFNVYDAEGNKTGLVKLAYKLEFEKQKPSSDEDIPEWLNF